MTREGLPSRRVLTAAATEVRTDDRRTNVYLVCTHSFWSDQLRIVSLSREIAGFCAFGFSLAYAFEFNFEGLCKTWSLNLYNVHWWSFFSCVGESEHAGFEFFEWILNFELAI